VPSSCTSAHCKYNRNANSGAGTIDRASIVCKRMDYIVSYSNEWSFNQIYVHDRQLSMKCYLIQELENFLRWSWWIVSKRVFLLILAAALKSPYQLYTTNKRLRISWESKLAFVEKDRAAIKLWIVEKRLKHDSLDVTSNYSCQMPNLMNNDILIPECAAAILPTSRLTC